MAQTVDLVVRNIGQLVTMCPPSSSSSSSPRHSDPALELGIIPEAAIAVAGERIVWVGMERDLGDAGVLTSPAPRTIDAGGRVAMPGLVDCHTHLVFAGSRAEEFASRLSGSSYEEILAAGGGIHSTVQATREVGEEILVSLGLERLKRFLEFGVTTVEIKSGYGLELESELKILRVARKLSRLQPVDVVPTFLGAHTVPREYLGDRNRYVDLVVREMLPKVAEEGLARFVDVFCERGAFSLEETRRILEAGLKFGLRPKLHAEQLSRSGSVALAVELGATSVDHLEHVTEDDAKALAASGIVGVLLPGATYFVGKSRYAPGRMLRDAGCRLAVSTDYNPGSCMSENLPLMLNLACVSCRLRPAEALLGATLHAARALGLQDQLGSLAPGKLADVLVLHCRDWREFIYHFGINQSWMVFKRGQRVVPSTPFGDS